MVDVFFLISAFPNQAYQPEVLLRLAGQARQEALALAKQVEVLRKASALRDDERLESADQGEDVGEQQTQHGSLDLIATSMDLA